MAVSAPVTPVFSSVFKQANVVRSVAGMILLVLVSLFSTIKLTKPAEQFIARFAGITEVVPDSVTLAERRFSKLRPMLPSHGTIGYVTDDDKGGYAAYERYLVVRYVLAPLLVENSSTHALVVGNITKPKADTDHFLLERNLNLLKNLGDGVLLLEGAPR